MSTESEQSVLNIIQGIKEGRVDPDTIDKEVRQKCVEILQFEAYKSSEMAQIFKCSDKTIKRDLAEIQEKNALSPDINWAKKFIGDFVLKAQNSHNYLSKLARSKDCSVSEKVQAEYFAHLVESDVVTKLQSLGYLPTVAQSIVGNFYNYGSIEQETISLREDITELQTICPESKELSVLQLKVEAISNQGNVDQEEVKQNE